MADNPDNKSRKPRIRKAPSVREQAVLERQKAERPTKKTKAGKVVKSPFRLLGLVFGSRVARAINKPFKPVWRFLRFIGRWIIPRYFINSWREVRLVTWPGRRETWRLTGAVFVFAIIFGTMVALLDKGLDDLFKHYILK